MFDAVQTFFANLWKNIILPGLVFLLIAGSIFAIGLAVGLSGFGDSDRKLETFRSESIEDRQRIEGLNNQLRTVKDRISELDASNRKFEDGFSRIGNQIEGLSISSGNNLEQLRRIIDALTEIQAITKGLGDS